MNLPEPQLFHPGKRIKSNLHGIMAVVLTLFLIIALELSGLYLASQLGQSIRQAFRKTKMPQRSPRLRWLDVMIGYAAIFAAFGIFVYIISHWA